MIPDIVLDLCIWFSLAACAFLSFGSGATYSGFIFVALLAVSVGKFFWMRAIREGK